MDKIAAEAAQKIADLVEWHSLEGQIAGIIESALSQFLAERDAQWMALERHSLIDDGEMFEMVLVKDMEALLKGKAI